MKNLKERVRLLEQATKPIAVYVVVCSEEELDLYHKENILPITARNRIVPFILGPKTLSMKEWIVIYGRGDPIEV